MLPLEVVRGVSCSSPLLTLPLDGVCDVSDSLGFSVGSSGCASDCSVRITDVVGVSVWGFTVGTGGYAFVPKVNLNIELSFKVALQ